MTKDYRLLITELTVIFHLPQSREESCFPFSSGSGKRQRLSCLRIDALGFLSNLIQFDLEKSSALLNFFTDKFSELDALIVHIFIVF